MTALLSFGLYMIGVFVLAIVANRAGRKKAFVSEYFLGSKSIGLWAFAFTYAATSASGGSFMGFPSLIYTHGWVLAWWIAGYMVVPIIALGLLAKRINQVGRIAGAITIPELFRRRFESRRVGNLATLLVVFFMFFFLMAQFKAGAQIMATLFEGAPVFESAVVGIEKITAELPWIGAAEGDYLLCLLVFAVSVIAYTTFGGFRAVVWTDVMQGVVMGLGVIIMLVLTLAQVGGLGNATRKLGEMTPPQEVRVHVILDEPATELFRVPKGEWIRLGEDGLVRLRSSFTMVPYQRETEWIDAFRITTQAEIEQILQSGEVREGMKATLFGDPKPYAYGDGLKGVYLTAPGPSATSATGFLGVMLALSFFSFWTFSGAGQPSYMVRQMAFRDTLTLRRSIVMVAVYFSLIYFPLVIIFTCARVLLPGMEVHPDRVMPEMAALLTSNAGVPWLAGLLIAAPFAAVMSSVDSFLLLVSSGVVRDVYQESINPKASEKQVKRLSYLVTTVVGILGVLAVMHPPQFLQHLIVFAAAGLGACFLMPMIFALYWPRSTSRGIMAGMLAGGITVLVLYLVGFLFTKQFGEYLLLGVHPFLWAVLFSSLAILIGSLTDEPIPEPLKERYFGASSPTAQR